MLSSLLLALAATALTAAQRLKVTNNCPSALTLTAVNHADATGPLPLSSATNSSGPSFVALALAGTGVAIKVTRDTEQPGTGAAEVILGYSIAAADGKTVYYSLDQVHGELFANATNAVGVWGPGQTGTCGTIEWVGGKRPAVDLVSSCVLGTGAELRLELCARRV